MLYDSLQVLISVVLVALLVMTVLNIYGVHEIYKQNQALDTKIEEQFKQLNTEIQRLDAEAKHDATQHRNTIQQELMKLIKETQKTERCNKT